MTNTSKGDDLFAKLCEDLLKIAIWLKNNLLLLNWDKSNAIIFSNKTSAEPSITVLGNKIEVVTQVKLLGVQIDDELKFKQHVQYICNKVNKKTAMLNKHLYLFSYEFRSTIFKLFVLPHFEYCSTIFFSSSNENIYMLERSFKRSCRQITHINLHGCNVGTQCLMLRPLGVLPLRLRLFCHYINFVYKLFVNQRAIDLLNFLKKRDTPLSTRSEDTFYRSGSNLNIGKYSFITISTKLLNSFLYNHILNISLNKQFLIDNALNLYTNSFSYFGHNKLN